MTSPRATDPTTWHECPACGTSINVTGSSEVFAAAMLTQWRKAHPGSKACRALARDRAEADQ